MLEALGQTLALNHCGETDPNHLVSVVERLGFSGLQLAISMPCFDVEQWSEERLETLQRRLRDARLTLSLDCSQRAGPLWLPRDVSRGVITYYGRVLSAAERLGAWAVVASVGCTPSENGSCDPWVFWPDSEVAQLRNILRANLLRLAGLAAGRCEVCLTAGDMNQHMWDESTPLIEQGYLQLCVELTPEGDWAVRPECRPFLEQHMNRVRMVRLMAGFGAARQPVLEELLRLNIREWVIVANDAQVAACARDVLRASLEQAWTTVAGGHASQT